MRWLLLLGFIALATVARAEEDTLEDEEVDLLESVDEDTQLRIGRMLGDLFVFDDDDDAEHNEELGEITEGRAMDDESAVEQKAILEPGDLARYNKFMDTFFRRLNADARQTIDPMEVGIMPKKDKKSSAKKGDEKKGRRKNPKINKKKPDNKKQKNKDKNKNKNKKRKQNKNKKKGRHPKNLDLNEIEENEDDGDEEAAIAEEEVHHVVTRDAEHVEKIEEEEDNEEEEALERQERSADVVDEDESIVASEFAISRSGKALERQKTSADVVDDKVSKDVSEVAISRSGKPKGNKKTKSKKRKQGGKKKGGKGKGNKKNNKNNKNNNNNKNKKKTKRSAKKNKGSKKKPKTSRASVSGVATLTRIGDVSVVDRKGVKELRTEFKMGPVSLKVNRRFGSGKDAVVRTASAESPELTGKMHLSVASNGKAKITKFNILRPSVVTTSGNLNKDGARLDNNNFMEKSIGRFVPFAAKKLKIQARDVLRETESKN